MSLTNLPALLPDLAAPHFLRPWWLLGLLLLPALAVYWRHRQRRRNAWRGAVDAHLLPHLLSGGELRQGLPWAWLLALGLGVLALAGPSWRDSAQPLWQGHIPLVIALDLSEPAMANDLPPTRLQQARARIAGIVAERAGGQVGLVAYSDDAYTVAPLTDDVANIALFLDALSPDVMPDYGADLAHGDAGRAIVHARRLLQRAGFARGDILLLGGGADARARDAAASAAAAGYRVQVLGLGRAGGGQYPRAGGGEGSSRLDADALSAVASAGGGRFVAAGTGGSDLRALGVLEPEAADVRAARGERRQVALDQGWWLLPPLLLLALLLFRRGAVLGVLALGLALPLAAPPLQAQTAPATQPQVDADGSLWRRPDQQAHAQQRAGEDAYRRGDFAAAERAFAADASARGQYNLGNALAKQGRFGEAIAAYDRALAQQPQMQDAIENRRIVQAAQRQQPPQGGQQPQSRQPQQGQGNPQSGGQQQGRDGGQDPAPRSSQADGQPPPSPSPSQGSQPRQPQDDEATQAADAQRQAQADAAQRERMQRALQESGQSGEQQATAPPRPETAEERERRIVNEAQLRRVQDDPGGLLRAKFRLERQRRLDGGNR